MLRLHWSILVTFLVGKAAASEGSTFHEVLGLTRSATFEDIQHAYQSQAQKHYNSRTTLDHPESWFVEVHRAYEAISNQGMKWMLCDLSIIGMISLSFKM